VMQSLGAPGLVRVERNGDNGVTARTGSDQDAEPLNAHDLMISRPARQPRSRGEGHLDRGTRRRFGMLVRVIQVRCYRNTILLAPRPRLASPDTF
jgi:hypothetical protein